MEWPAASVPHAGRGDPVHRLAAGDEVAMAALEIVLVATSVLLLITLFLYVWGRLGWIGDHHSHVAPAHRHLDVPPHDHEELRG